MKLVRNTTQDGSCKYAAVRMDKIAELSQVDQQAACAALEMLADLGVLETGKAGSEEEFFLIKLKDNHAAAALWAYAKSVHGTDPEFSDEVAALARRSREREWRKEPDTAPAAYGVSPTGVDGIKGIAK